MGCLKCGGFVYPRKVFVLDENKSYWENVCLHCGEIECPPENRELLQLNFLVYRAKEKTNRMGMW